MSKANLFIRVLKLLMPPRVEDNGEESDNLYNTQKYNPATVRWRWAVFWWLVVLTTVLTLFVPFSFTKIPIVSDYMPGFALAGETEKKIDTAVQPIKKELGEQRQILNSITRQLNDQLANSVATEIRLLISKRCKEPDHNERDRLWREKDRKQDEYQAMRGQRYTEPSCSDL